MIGSVIVGNLISVVLLSVPVAIMVIVRRKQKAKKVKDFINKQKGVK